MGRQQCLLLQALFLMSCSGSSCSFSPPGRFRLFCCCHCSMSHLQSRTPLVHPAGLHSLHCWSSALQVSASLGKGQGKGSLKPAKVSLVEMEWLLPRWLKAV